MHTPATRGYDRQRGFTLLEMVMVIVLLGAIGAGLGKFITTSVTAYLDVARRDDVAQQARFAIERMTRELRNALPGSVRVNSSGGASAVQCLEFVPIVAASAYLDLPVGTPATSFQAVDFEFNPATGIAYYAAVYTTSNSTVYGAAPSNALRAISTVSVSVAEKRTVSFAAPSQFPQHSPQKRFFVVASPVSFCVQDNLITRHADYSYATMQGLPPPNGVTLARYIRLQENGAGYSIFDFSPGSLQRNSTVQIDLRFLGEKGDEEWVRFSQTVFLRNVP